MAWDEIAEGLSSQEAKKKLEAISQLKVGIVLTVWEALGNWGEASGMLMGPGIGTRNLLFFSRSQV